MKPNAEPWASGQPWPSSPVFTAITLVQAAINTRLDILGVVSNLLSLLHLCPLHNLPTWQLEGSEMKHEQATPLLQPQVTALHIWIKSRCQILASKPQVPGPSLFSTLSPASFPISIFPGTPRKTCYSLEGKLIPPQAFVPSGPSTCPQFLLISAWWVHLRNQVSVPHPHLSGTPLPSPLTVFLRSYHWSTAQAWRFV